MKVETKLLADCQEVIPSLAQLWFEEIGKIWIPNASVPAAVDTYLTHTNRDHLPITYVALVEDQPIGMVSLRDNDGVRSDLSPWLGSLIVHPSYRSQGIGNMLINVVKQRAFEMNFNQLYLLTLDKTIPHWYTKLGWSSVAADQLYHHPITIMKIMLTKAMNNDA